MARRAPDAQAELIPLREAADRLGIARSTAHDLVRRGDFPVPPVRVGRSWMVNREKLDVFIAGDAGT